MGKRIFISYVSEEKHAADAICASLETRGYDCWMAPRDIMPGTTYAEAIVQAIDKSEIMILVFSSRANSSPHILREVEQAVHDKLIIIPVKIDKSRPSDAMRYYIGAPQWLDASEPPLEKHLDLLSNTIKTYLDRKTGDTSAISRPQPPVPAMGKPDMASEQPMPRYLQPPEKKTPASPKSTIKTIMIAIALLAFILICVDVAISGNYPKQITQPTTSPTIRGSVNNPSLTSTPGKNSSSRTFVTAAVSDSYVKTGDTIKIFGSAPDATSISISIFPLSESDSNSPEILFKKDYEVIGGVFNIMIQMNLPPGQYGIMAETPGGDYTKLQCIVTS